MSAVWRAGNYCVHHKIVPNSEYISAKESKPNPGERYDAVDYSQRKKNSDGRNMLAQKRNENVKHTHKNNSDILVVCTTYFQIRIKVLSEFESLV